MSDGGFVRQPMYCEALLAVAGPNGLHLQLTCLLNRGHLGEHEYGEYKWQHVDPPSG